eukprot:1547198-Amphidinium_carterae.1
MLAAVVIHVTSASNTNLRLLQTAVGSGPPWDLQVRLSAVATKKITCRQECWARQFSKKHISRELQFSVGLRTEQLGLRCLLVSALQEKYNAFAVKFIHENKDVTRSAMLHTLKRSKRP